MVSFRKGLGDRNKLFQKSLASLLWYTTYPFELILIDNTENNRGLGMARNEGASRAIGEYVVFTDDDIFFKKGWLEECIKLVNMGTKYMATPVIQHRVGKWELSRVNGYRQNYRTGSNCMVMRRSSYDLVGPFQNKSVPTDGMNYADRIARAGYTFLLPNESLAFDMAPKVHSYGDQHNPWKR